MLVQRRRWQDNIDLALGERLVFGMCQPVDDPTL